ncbi:MAG: serine aminopeptidase domain-containing protein [Candidatus Hodarchaeota archaeon]
MVETKDNVQISFNTYQPINGDKKMKAIIIGHGIMVNKEMLKSYAIELASSGFFVVSCDFRGHGLSTGELERNKLKNDIKAVKKFLNDRGDIDNDNYGYIGYSMGGLAGNDIIKDDYDFKCFIGIGTSLGLDYEDCKNRYLNILMILAKYDQAFNLKGRKEEIAERLNIDEEDVNVNKLYGSFEDGNATKLFYDDNSDHFATAYDQDFLREARDWVINTFPDIDPIEEDFYANLRALFLIMQLIGGVGFFFLIIKPLSNLIAKLKEEDLFEIKTEDETITTLSLKTIIYSIALAIPGMFIILLTIFLFLPLSTAGLSIAILFGQAFGIFILLWRIGKKNKLSIKEILIKPFRVKREDLFRQIALGAIIASILYTILYLSIGLNYLGIIPSLNKFLWIPIYFAIGFFMFIIFSILFQAIIQVKFEKGLRNLFKAALLHYVIVMVYFISYILIICVLLGNFFYIMFLYFAVPMFLLSVFISALLYQKTRNILSGAIVNTVFFILIICTLSPLTSGLSIIF